MNSVATVSVLIPGAVACWCFSSSLPLEQNRHNYFRAWQLAWAAYTLHYALKAVEYYQGPSPLLFLLSSLCWWQWRFASSSRPRLMKESFHLKWYDVALTVTGSCWRM